MPEVAPGGPKNEDTLGIMKKAGLAAVILTGGILFATASSGGAADPAAVERALDQFLAAPTRAAAERLINGVVESGATFDQAYERL